MHTTISVRLARHADRSYKIHIHPGLFNELADFLAGRRKRSDIFIITDSNVRELYGRRLLKALTERGANAWLLDFPAGEASKNKDVVFGLQTGLLEHGIRRESSVVALGGGVVGDVAGFVASTVLRGVNYVQVPTTLLAQVDSSVGGKVGIDHPAGKNLIGAFHQPKAVYVDPLLLRTLPREEMRNGLAEVVKIAAALDAEFFRELERKTSHLLKAPPEKLSSLIAQSVGLKASVVRKDEHDKGLRKVLNLGHTIGHAIEAATSYTVPHGAAVSMGLAMESLIALNMGLLGQPAYSRLVKVLHALRLPTKSPKRMSMAKFLSALSADKKTKTALPEFVLLKNIGHSVIGVEVPTPFMLEVMKD